MTRLLTLRKVSPQSTITSASALSMSSFTKSKLGCSPGNLRAERFQRCTVCARRKRRELLDLIVFANHSISIRTFGEKAYAAVVCPQCLLNYLNIMNVVRREVSPQQVAGARIRFERSDDGIGKQLFVVNRADADVGSTVENYRIFLIAGENRSNASRQLHQKPKARKLHPGNATANSRRSRSPADNAALQPTSPATAGR